MSRTPICIRFVVPLLLAAPVAAHALQGDRIRPYVGGVYNYYSNLFYLDDSLQNSQVSFLKDGQRHDMSYGLRAGVDADIPWSRQNFVIRTQITDTKYVTYDQLDYLGYNARGTWNWAIGDKWDGDLGASFVQSLGTFTDFQGTGGRTKNVRKQEEFYGSAMYRLTYDLKLRAAVRNVKLKNEAANFQQFDRDDMIYEVGPRYYSKGGENFLGLTLRMTDGKFPNRQVLPGSMLDNGYKEYSMLGVVDYRYSGETSLRGELGWTERRNDQLSQRDFDGVTGRLNVTYSPSGVVGVFASVFREIGAFQDVTTNYILTQGFRIGPSYRYSEKLQFQASYNYARREFLGDPNIILMNQDTRIDTTNGVSASANWTPTRNSQVSATLSYDTRDSNRQLTDFKATTFFVSAQLNF